MARHRREADTNIEHLADVTGGKSYFIKDDDSSEALQQAFSGACTYQSIVNNDDLKFKLFETTASARRSVEGCFDVDATVGRNLKLSVFNLENRNNVESMKLKGPSDDVFDRVDFDTSTATVTVALAQVYQMHYQGCHFIQFVYSVLNIGWPMDC